MRLGFLSAAVLILGLAGCGSIMEEEVSTCPAASILGDAADVTVFRAGPGRDLPDVHYHAQLTNLATRCDFGRTRGTNYAYGRLNFDVEVALGSAAYPAPVDVRYFVAVIDSTSQRILTREVFSVHAPLSSEHRSITVADHIGRVAIPIEARVDGGNYELVIGFELTPEQVAFNRTRSR